MQKGRNQRRRSRSRVKNLRLKIGEKSFHVFNLSPGGVGFFLDNVREFPVGGSVGAIILEINPPLSLSGKTRHITHISEIDDDVDTRCEWICGIEFQTPSNSNRKQVIDQSITEYLEGIAA